MLALHARSGMTQNKNCGYADQERTQRKLGVGALITCIILQNLKNILSNMNKY